MNSEYENTPPDSARLLKEAVASQLRAILGSELEDDLIERLSDVDTVIQAVRDTDFGWPEALATFLHVDIRHQLGETHLAGLRTAVLEPLESLVENLRSEASTDDPIDLQSGIRRTLSIRLAHAILTLRTDNRQRGLEELHSWLGIGSTTSGPPVDDESRAVFDTDPFLRSLSYFKSRVRISLVTDAAIGNDWQKLNRIFKAWFKSYTGTSFRIHEFELKFAAASIADATSDLELRSFSDVREFTGAWAELLELVNNLWAECEIDPDDVDSVTDELDDWIWPDELNTNTRPYWAYQYGITLSRMATSIRNSSGRLDSQAVLEDLTQDYAWTLGVDMAEWLALDLQGVEWGRSDWAFSQFNLRPSPEEPGYGILDARPAEDEYWAMRCGLEKGQDSTISDRTVVDITALAEDIAAVRSIVEASSLRSTRDRLQIFEPMASDLQETQDQIRARLPLTMNEARARVESSIPGAWHALPDDIQIYLALAEKHIDSDEFKTAILDYTRAVEGLVQYLITHPLLVQNPNAEVRMPRGRGVRPLAHVQNRRNGLRFVSLSNWAWNLENAIGGNSDQAPSADWANFVADAIDGDDGPTRALIELLYRVQGRRGGSAHYEGPDEISRAPGQMIEMRDAVLGTDDRPGAITLLQDIFGGTHPA